MDSYYTLFSLPLSFSVDTSALTKQYYALSKEYHPDKFTLATEADQTAAMLMSSKINAGYKVLKKEQARIRHILELLGAAPTEGQETMPQDFLMEMMDLNEAIMDYKMDPSADSKDKITSEIAAFEGTLREAFNVTSAGFDFSNPASEKLAEIKAYYLKTKYLNRLKDNLKDRAVDI